MCWPPSLLYKGIVLYCVGNLYETACKTWQLLFFIFQQQLWPDFCLNKVCSSRDVCIFGPFVKDAYGQTITETLNWSKVLPYENICIKSILLILNPIKLTIYNICKHVFNRDTCFDNFNKTFTSFYL